MADYKILYTSRASKDQENIYQNLLERWGMESVKKLDKKIEKVLALISKRPKMYPAYQQNNIRRCVISKQTSLYYRIKTNHIQLITFFDTRQDPLKKKVE